MPARWFAPPTPETAAIFFGTWKLGAILLSMSVLYSDEGIAHRLRDSEPKVLVTDGANAHRFSGPHVPPLLVLDAQALASESDRFQTAGDYAQALTDFLRRERRIAPQKLPEMLQVVDSLPTTMTGKVQKFLLRGQARALADQQP